MIIHKDLLESRRWYQMSLMVQLANIGSEISRTVIWKNNNNPVYSQQAFFRALELLDFTIYDPKNKGCRRKEMVRMREALVDHFMFDNEYNTTDEIWLREFYNYGYAAALERGR
jgi:hypothetical protein